MEWKFTVALKPVWLEVNLAAIIHNVSALREYLPPSCAIFPVVKSDAYGMGLPEVAAALRQEGLDFFCVGSVEEALKLAHLANEILLMHPPLREEIPLIVEKGLIQAVSSLETAGLLSEEAEKQKKPARVHLKANLGMNRLGFRPSALIQQVSSLLSLPRLWLEGIFGHFSSADSEDTRTTLREFQIFDDLLRTLDKKGAIFSCRHLCNSAAILNFPQFCLDGVRPGILLYGVNPSILNQDKIPLRRAVAVKSRVVHSHEVERGERVSYHQTWEAPVSGNLATIPAGYADGIPRAISSNGHVLINGERFPIAGQVCMDLTVVYTGKKRVAVGDEVVFIGNQGKEEIRVEEWARWGNLDPHEVLTGIGKSLPKTYYNIPSGREVSKASPPFAAK